MSEERTDESETLFMYLEQELLPCRYTQYVSKIDQVQVCTKCEEITWRCFCDNAFTRMRQPDREPRNKIKSKITTFGLFLILLVIIVW